MGGDMGGGMPPPMGGPMGGMDPMGGMGGPMGGEMPQADTGQQAIQAQPMDVWDAIEKVLGKTNSKQPKQQTRQQQPGVELNHLRGVPGF